MNGHPGYVAKSPQSAGFQTGCRAMPDAPEIREGSMIPELFPETLFVKLGYANTVFVRGDVFGHDVHRDLA